MISVDLSKEFGASRIASTDGNVSVPGREEVKIGLNGDWESLSNPVKPSFDHPPVIALASPMDWIQPFSRILAIDPEERVDPG